jgi:hypothetical protein
MLVGKGKRGADLLKARRVLPLAQKPIRFQSWSTVLLAAKTDGSVFYDKLGGDSSKKHTDG